jgi:ribosomal protein S18 acetylase RimI-like enzyme
MNITYQINVPLENAAMNALFASAWGRPYAVDFQPELEAALCFIAAFDGLKLVGFVKLVGDAGVHAFLLDPSVDAEYKRRGIGRELVDHGCEWVHVDFDDDLEAFYAACGFKPTKAGLIQL